MRSKGCIKEESQEQGRHIKSLKEFPQHKKTPTTRLLIIKPSPVNNSAINRPLTHSNNRHLELTNQSVNPNTLLTAAATKNVHLNQNPRIKQANHNNHIKIKRQHNNILTSTAL